MALKARFGEHLAALTAIDGVSGHEGAVVVAMRDLLAPLCDVIKVDVIGNVYATRHGGGGPSLMVGVHSDEIGGIVSAVGPDGFVRFQLVGGAREIMLVGRKVRIRGQRGVVGVRPGHLQAPGEARTAPDSESLYVDLGCTTREEVRALGIREGDGITWQSELESMANPDRVCGKAIDNRAGCVVGLELLRTLQGEELSGDLTVVVAVQEEVGLKGAAVAARRLRPDRALIVDTVPCSDTPDARHVNTFPTRLGAGPVLQVSSGARASGYLMPEPIRDYLTRIADDAGIPYQLATFAYGNTDASSVYVRGEGIPTAVVTMPRRYSHSPVEVLDLNDAVATVRLCTEIVRHVDAFPGGLLG